MISSKSASLNLLNRTKMKRIKNLTAAAETLKLHDKLDNSFSNTKPNYHNRSSLSFEINDDLFGTSNTSQINSTKSNRKLIKFNNLYKSLEVSLLFLIIFVILFYYHKQ